MLQKTAHKIAIIGAGTVGTTTAYTLMQTGLIAEIALIDCNEKKVAGEIADLQQGIQFTRLTKIYGGSDYALVKNAHVIVITAGQAQIPNQSRLDLLLNNYTLFKTIIPSIVSYNKEAILLVVTNPVDLMTSIALALSKLDHCQIFGTGTVLDSARLRYILGNKLDVSPKDVIAHVLGEHGDNEFIAWSTTSIAGIPLDRFYTLSEKEKNEIATEVKNAAYTIISKKGSTCYAIALVISKIICAIVLNQSRLFTLSTSLNQDSLEIPLCMSMPTIITGGGICKKIPLQLSNQEMNAWNTAKEKLLQTLKTLILT